MEALLHGQAFSVGQQIEQSLGQHNRETICCREDQRVVVLTRIPVQLSCLEGEVSFSRSRRGDDCVLVHEQSGVIEVIVVPLVSLDHEGQRAPRQVNQRVVGVRQLREEAVALPSLKIEMQLLPGRVTHCCHV